MQFAKGLKYLHDNKILHRDLKPSNLLLTAKDVVKICDFGLSIRLSDLQTDRETLYGTPNYLAPELLNNEPYGIKSDCWSFGCILYSMATGSPPFEGNNTKDTFAKIKKGKICFPDYISENLKNLLRNLLNMNQNLRFDVNAALSHPFFSSRQNLSPSPISSYGLPITAKKTQRCATECDEVGSKYSFDSQFEKNSKVEIKKTVNHNKCLSTMIAPQISARQSVYPANIVVQEKKYQSPYLDQIPERKENSRKLENYLNFQNKNPSNQKVETETIHRKTLTSIPNLDINRPITPLVGRNRIEDKKGRVRNIETKLKDSTYNLTPNQTYETEESSSSSSKPSKRIIHASLALNTTSRTNTSPCRGTERFLSFDTEEDIDQYTERRLKPLNTFGLQLYKLQTKNGLIEIDESGTISIDIPKMQRKLSISQDGLKIHVRKAYPDIEERNYDLFRLPYKYHKFYEYASQVCDLIKSKIPKTIIEDKDGIFSLRETAPTQSFEAVFRNGIKAQHMVSSEIIKLDMNNGSVHEINMMRDLSYLGNFICSVVEKTLGKLKLCIEKQNRTQS